ncbi:MAG: hypothetical protein ACREX4_10305 [Gammaproteobacteria bacterium]
MAVAVPGAGRLSVVTVAVAALTTAPGHWRRGLRVLAFPERLCAVNEACVIPGKSLGNTEGINAKPRIENF